MGFVLLGASSSLLVGDFATAVATPAVLSSSSSSSVASQSKSSPLKSFNVSRGNNDDDAKENVVKTTTTSRKKTIIATKNANKNKNKKKLATLGDIPGAMTTKESFEDDAMKALDGYFDFHQRDASSSSSSSSSSIGEKETSNVPVEDQKASTTEAFDDKDGKKEVVDLSSAVKTALEDARVNVDDDPSLEDLKTSLKSGKTVVNGKALLEEEEENDASSSSSKNNINTVEVEAEKLLKEASEETRRSLSSSPESSSSPAVGGGGAASAQKSSQKYVPITTSRSMRSLSPTAQKYLRPQQHHQQSSLRSDLTSSARSVYSNNAVSKSTVPKVSLAAKYASMFGSRSSDGASSSSSSSGSRSRRSGLVSVAHPQSSLLKAKETVVDDDDDDDGNDV